MIYTRPSDKRIRNLAARPPRPAILGRPMPREIPALVWRGGWRRSDTYHRCGRCGALTVCGVCVAGCPVPVCCGCHRARVAGGEYVATIPGVDRIATHGYCIPCALAALPEHMHEKFLSRQKKEAA